MRTVFNLRQEFIVRPPAGSRFAPDCIKIGTKVPIKSDGEVVGKAVVVEVRPDAVILRPVRLDEVELMEVMNNEEIDRS